MLSHTGVIGGVEPSPFHFHFIIASDLIGETEHALLRSRARGKEHQTTKMQELHPCVLCLNDAGY